MPHPNLAAIQRIGLISDTHGLLRPQALEALAGVELVVHAGDIGSPDVLAGLQALAPVVAVRGNNDVDAWARPIPETLDLQVGGARMHLLHDLHLLDARVLGVGVDIVVAGHSHRPGIERRAGVVYLNPGSAGPRRFRLPVSVALLERAPMGFAARIVELSV